MAQKPPDLDAQGNPVFASSSSSSISTRPPDLDANHNPITEPSRFTPTVNTGPTTRTSAPIREINPRIAETYKQPDYIQGQEPSAVSKEPDTYWGGFFKSLVGSPSEAFSAKNEMLQSAGHPQSTSDFLNLIIPAEMPNLKDVFSSTRSRLPQIAEEIVSPKFTRTPPQTEGNVKFSTKAEMDNTETKFHETPGFPKGQARDRLYELIDKEKAGTLTGKELNEARRLDKQLRGGGIPPRDLPPDFTPVGGEASFNSQFDKPVVKTTEEAAHEIATRSQGMGLPQKPRIKLTGDGGYTNLDTGEVFPPQSQSKSFDPSTLFKKDEPLFPPANTPEIMPMGEGFGERPRGNPESNQTFELNDQSGFDQTRQFFIDDSARMKAERLAREADPVYQASQKAKMDDWNTTQSNLRINSQVEKEFGIDFMSGSDKSYSDLSPAEQAKFDNRVSELQNKSKFKSSTIDVEPSQLEAKPTAEFLGLQQDGKPLFNIKGGNLDKSTVSAEKLQELGIEQPVIPSDAKPMRGEDLRAQALGRRQLGTANDMPAKSNKKFITKEDISNLNPQHPSAVQWHENVKYLDSINAPDSAYRDILSTGGRDTLKRGESWRSKVVKYIKLRDEGYVKPRNFLSDESGVMNISSGNKPPTSPPNGPMDSLFNRESHQGPPVEPDKSGLLQSIYDLPRGLMSVDPPFMTSAAFRQGNSFIGTKPWFQGWVKAAKAFGSKAASEAQSAEIAKNPLFKVQETVARDKFGAPIIDKATGSPKVVTKPSIAEEAGLRLGDLTKYSKRDDAIRSELSEKVPIYGKYVAASNRAFTAFLNHVSSSVFSNLYNDATKLGHSPQTNLVLGRQIAEFVNTALKRGKLGAEIGSHEVNLERNARLLSNTFFSPRTIASQTRMLNPSTYVMADPFVRKQYLKAMLRQVGTWWTMAEAAKFGSSKVSVSKDPNSADFGKIKIGNTRIDPPGGLQQYLVLGNRMLPSPQGGGITNTSTNAFQPFGKGYKPETRGSTLEAFGVNRLHPTAKTVWDLLHATQSKPFHVGDRIIQMAAPMYADDLMQIAKDDPELAPLIISTAASGSGMGTQSYERGSFGKPTFLPEKWDINIGAK